MNTRILLSVAFITLFLSCKNETPETTTDPVTEAIKPEGPKTTCYSFEGNGNSVSLQMETEGSEVSGTMVYSLAEKDKNTGTFKGIIENNIIVADYTFQSEGVESSRQIAFEIKGDQLIEGFGEMNEDGTKFKDVKELKFNSTMPLSKIECP